MPSERLAAHYQSYQRHQTTGVHSAAKLLQITRTYQTRKATRLVQHQSSLRLRSTSRHGLTFLTRKATQTDGRRRRHPNAAPRPSRLEDPTTSPFGRSVRTPGQTSFVLDRHAGVLPPIRSVRHHLLHRQDCRNATLLADYGTWALFASKVSVARSEDGGAFVLSSYGLLVDVAVVGYVYSELSEPQSGWRERYGASFMLASKSWLGILQTRRLALVGRAWDSEPRVPIHERHASFVASVRIQLWQLAGGIATKGVDYSANVEPHCFT